MQQVLGALVALLVVLGSFFLLSRLATERFAARRASKVVDQRSRTLTIIEAELEELEARKSSRTAEDNETYARLIRRRNALVAAG